MAFQAFPVVTGTAIAIFAQPPSIRLVSDASADHENPVLELLAVQSYRPTRGRMHARIPKTRRGSVVSLGVSVKNLLLNSKSYAREWRLQKPKFELPRLPMFLSWPCQSG